MRRIIVLFSLDAEKVDMYLLAVCFFIFGSSCSNNTVSKAYDVKQKKIAILPVSVEYHYEDLRRTVNEEEKKEMELKDAIIFQKDFIRYYHYRIDNNKSRLVCADADFINSRLRESYGNSFVEDAVVDKYVGNTLDSDYVLLLKLQPNFFFSEGAAYAVGALTGIDLEKANIHFSYSVINMKGEEIWKYKGVFSPQQAMTNIEMRRNVMEIVIRNLFANI